MESDSEPISVGRRFVVAGLLSAAAAPAAGAEPDSYENVRKVAAELAASMAAIHGGNWEFHIDHAAGLAVVSSRAAS